jgi:hypothetical protein
VITGFNTDIEHEGVIYHVQTEDKGLDSPLILSLVYVGGTILASKRSPYQDLIVTGFSDEVLAERLKRQHRLICAAINSGRIDDLKKMSGRGKAPSRQQDAVETSAIEDEVEADVETAPATIEEPFEVEYWPVSQEWTPPPAPVDEELAAVIEPGMEPRYEPVESIPAPPPEPEPVVEEVQPEEVLVSVIHCVSL